MHFGISRSIKRVGGGRRYACGSESGGYCKCSPETCCFSFSVWLAWWHWSPRLGPDRSPLRWTGLSRLRQHRPKRLANRRPNWSQPSIKSTPLCAEWSAEGIEPADRADDLAVARRLALALVGTVPSLEEIRRFEATSADTRLAAYADALLSDRRSADYLAERLARTYVGVEDGPFIVYRRRRFVTWLADQLAANRPYDQIVQELVASEGLWTDKPATNFVTVTLTDGAQKPNASRLAGRVARAFLGVRIDCAECHDHPFDRWKQQDFAGLAAFFGDTRQTFTGIRDDQHSSRSTKRTKADKKKTTEPAVQQHPAVPFYTDLLPTAGPPRQRLATWLVDPRNEAFSRAIVNRVWGLMFGRPLVEPVDNLPVSGEVPAAMDVLVKDFVAHGYDLRRLVSVIASSDVFRLASCSHDGQEISPRHAELWGAFPLARLRAEQTARAIFQARSLETVDQQTPLLFRVVQLVGQQEFVNRTGDLGEDELTQQSGTIPQRLLMMNGKIVRETTDEGNFLNASWRIATLAPDDAAAIETAYLATLTRRPTPEEADYFAERLAGSKQKERARRIEDLCWTLVNSMEFGWNH